MLSIFLLAGGPGCPVVSGEKRMDRTATAAFCIQPKARVTSRGIFFIWIRRNPLKTPESPKGIQGKARNFPWIYLDSLAFIYKEIALRL
jgi:hypothetical protein